MLALLCAVLAFALAWAVLDARINDGVIVKAGLILMTVGFSALSLRLLNDGEDVALYRAGSLVLAGLALAVGGAVYRSRR